MYKRRALLAATPVLLLGGCFGGAGNSQAALDARLIVTAVTPVAQNAPSLGATPEAVSVINKNLAIARGEAATMATEYAPGLLDVQEFLTAAQTLLQTLGALPGLPPASAGIVDAATALLPGFAEIAERPFGPAPRMTADQARLILRGTPAQAGGGAGGGAVAAPAPPPALPAPVKQPEPGSARTARFHLSANDFDGAVTYEFWDNGQMIEKGTVANLPALETRFAAFKRQRLQQFP